MNDDILEKVNEHITQADIAKHFNIKQSAVSQWKHTGIPAERVLAISNLIGGKVSCHEMRPDVFPE